MAVKAANEFKRAKAHTVYKTADGKRVPGVTTILNIIAKPHLVKWANNLGLEGIDSTKYTDKAASIGTLAHYMVECELKGEEPDLSPFSPEEVDKAENALLKWWDWKGKHVLEPVAVEMQGVSEAHRYGGTCDCICRLDGRLTLLDLKTGKAIYSEMRYQVAAYRQLAWEMDYPVERCGILRIGRDEGEGFEWAVYEDEALDRYWKVFVAAKALYDGIKEAK